MRVGQRNLFSIIARARGKAMNKWYKKLDAELYDLNLIYSKFPKYKADIKLLESIDEMTYIEGKEIMGSIMSKIRQAKNTKNIQLRNFYKKLNEEYSKTINKQF